MPIKRYNDMAIAMFKRENRKTHAFIKDHNLANSKSSLNLVRSPDFFEIRGITPTPINPDLENWDPFQPYSYPV